MLELLRQSLVPAANHLLGDILLVFHSDIHVICLIDVVDIPQLLSIVAGLDSQVLLLEHLVLSYQS